MDIANRLDEAMKAAGFDSQSALSRASGVPQPTINRILNRVGARGPDTKTLLALATACNVKFDWLISGDSAIGSNVFPLGDFKRVVVTDEDDPHFVNIQMVKLRLSAGITGFQADPDHSHGGTLKVPASWIERNRYIPDRLVAIRVRGESMEPSLYEDDVVIVNTGDTKPVDGGVYAVNYEGEAVVKRMSRDIGEWWLTSDNPDQRKYHRKMCRGGECIVVGRVIRKESERI